MKRLAPLLAVLLLTSACSDQDSIAEDADVSALPDDPASAANSALPVDGSPPANAVAAAPAEAVANAQAAAAVASIPAALLGRWGMTPADCTSTRGDAKGLLTIEPNRLVFYESRGVPTGNVQTRDDFYSADFAFTGEGMSWKRFQSLQIKDKRLVRTESTPMASYTYARCE